MTELNYKDVYLKPQKTIVRSRSECDTTVSLGNRCFVHRSFKMPVYPSNMKSVVNEDTCKFLAHHGWFYTMHRFGVNLVEFISSMKNDGLYTSISIGADASPLKPLKESPDFITLDVANGWSTRAECAVKEIKNMHPESFLIVGNVASAEAVYELEQWGADAIKVGIAGGHVCITKDKTGFHRPMVSTILECAKVAKVPIIADGGITTHGDIAKALACGAHMVMAGLLFSGYDESAGDVIEIEGKQYKEYFGSASEYNKSHKRNIEGRKTLVDYKGSMTRLLNELHEDLQSSISYAGGRDLNVFNPDLILEIR